MDRTERYPIKKVIGFDQPLIDAIDSYRRNQIAIPNFSDAIRAILTDGLRQHGGYIPETDEGSQ